MFQIIKKPFGSLPIPGSVGAKTSGIRKTREAPGRVIPGKRRPPPKPPPPPALRFWSPPPFLPLDRFFQTGVPEKISG